jgi:hypothetical protein
MSLLQNFALVIQFPQKFNYCLSDAAFNIKKAGAAVNLISSDRRRRRRSSASACVAVAARDVFADRVPHEKYMLGGFAAAHIIQMAASSQHETN